MMLGLLVKMFLYAVAGIFFGIYCPITTEKIVEYKCKKKNIKVPGYAWSTDEKGLCVLITTGIFVSTGYFFPGELSVLICIFSFIAVIGALVDYRVRIIPNEMVVTIFALGVLYNVIEGGWIQLCLSFAAGVGTFFLFLLAARLTFLLTKNFGVGAGDVKLAFAASFAVGWQRLTWFYLGIVIALTAYLLLGFYFKKLKIGSTFPMGGQIMGGFIAAYLLPVLLPLL